MEPVAHELFERVDCLCRLDLGDWPLDSTLLQPSIFCELADIGRCKCRVLVFLAFQLGDLLPDLLIPEQTDLGSSNLCSKVHFIDVLDDCGLLFLDELLCCIGDERVDATTAS